MTITVILISKNCQESFLLKKKKKKVCSDFWCGFSLKLNSQLKQNRASPSPTPFGEPPTKSTW